MGCLQGQVALITGGGAGIGRAVVARYLREGARVCATDIDGARLQGLRSAHGDMLHCVVADVTTVSGNELAVRETVAAFGRLDVFVANAGITDGFREIVDIPAADLAAAYRQIFDVNVLAVILGARVAAVELVKSRGSLIVTLSISSFCPDGGGVLYVASKHAALGVVRQLAHELAPFIRVNAVAPGATKTNIGTAAALAPSSHPAPVESDEPASGAGIDVAALTPLRLFSDPDDHSGAYVLLASRQDSRAMTGTVIESEGGLGVRGLRRVRGGDDLQKRLLGSKP